MLGFIFGTLCLIGLVKVLFRPYRYRRSGFLLRRLFQRLDTGPGQETVVLGEVESLKDTARGLRAELRTTKAEVAALLRDEQFDRAKLDALFRTQDELLGKLRAAAAGSFERIHGALDGRQKKALADLLEGGFWRGGYGYRCGY